MYFLYPHAVVLLMLGAVCQVLWPSKTVHCCSLSVCVHASACEIYIHVFVSASITDMHTFVSLSVSVLVCVSLRQPGLSSLDNQSLALVRQPSEAERSKAEADVYHSVHVCVFVCVQQQ